MRQLHWDNMSVIAGFDLTPDAGTTLRKIINMNLMEDLEKYHASDLRSRPDKSLRITERDAIVFQVRDNQQRRDEGARARRVAREDEERLGWRVLQHYTVQGHSGLDLNATRRHADAARGTHCEDTGDARLSLRETHREGRQDVLRVASSCAVDNQRVDQGRFLDSLHEKFGEAANCFF